MRTLIIVFALACALVDARGQAPTPTRRDWTLPASLAVKQDGPQTYRFTCDYYYLDIKGRLGRRERVSGLYTRDLPEDRMQWTDVTVAGSAGPPENLGPAQKRAFMEGFSYTQTAAKDMLKPAFFRGFPPAAMQERNLVWDTRMVESFGQDHFPDLKLNIPYHVPQPAELLLGGAGTFRHKDLELIWTGVSKRNGQECTVIDYRAFFNTLEIRTAAINLVGRSHYWGQVWVSLATKQIEYATLYEDLLGELSLPGQEKPQTVNPFRIGVFEPVKK